MPDALSILNPTACELGPGSFALVELTGTTNNGDLLIATCFRLPESSHFDIVLGTVEIRFAGVDPAFSAILGATIRLSPAQTFRSIGNLQLWPAEGESVGLRCVWYTPGFVQRAAQSIIGPTWRNAAGLLQLFQGLNLAQGPSNDDIAAIRAAVYRDFPPNV